MSERELRSAMWSVLNTPDASDEEKVLALRGFLRATDPDRSPLDRRRWRVGNHWGVTVIAEGSGQVDDHGRRLGDSLVATALSQEWARQICDDHNRWWKDELEP